jgi:uncharacterized membrane protein YdjX (TVP38/TMEM64 family)
VLVSGTLAVDKLEWFADRLKPMVVETIWTYIDESFMRHAFSCMFGTITCPITPAAIA